jgi:N-acetylneuraminic acid mutarotase
MKKYLIYQLMLCFGLGVFSLEAQNSWENKAAFGGTKRSRGIGFSIGSRGYIGTGEDTANNVLNDLWEYDPGSDLWIQKANLPGSGRRDATAFVIGNKGYVGFGINAAESFLGTEMDDFYEYDPVTNTWVVKAPIPVPGAGVYFCTGFAIGSKGYACGGKLGNSNYSDQLWE